MNSLEVSKQGLFEVVIVGGRKYITSHKFHRDYEPTTLLGDTNRSIRSAETYSKLVEEKHILEFSRNSQSFQTDAFFASLLKSNGYNPIMLLDRVAQKAMEHHFEVSAPQAVASSKENATLAAMGVDLSLIAANPQLMATMQAISLSLKAEKEAKEAKEMSQQNSMAIEENKMDSKLTTRQQVDLMKEIKQKTLDFSDAKVSGYILRDLKAAMLRELPANMCTYKDIPQRKFEASMELVKRWKPSWYGVRDMFS